jgi:arylsulfatase A-like enzyme
MNVGRLLKRLDDLDLLANTLVIFTSDHGDHFGKRPGGSKKRAAYDDCARIPFILRYPGLFEGGSVRDDLVSNVDLMPTILDVAGVIIPEGLHGRSLKSLVTGTGADWRDALVIENIESIAKEDMDAGEACESRAVRTDTRKLILREALSIRAKSLREFYDLAADPGEQQDMYGMDRGSEIMPLVDKLDTWAKATRDSTGRKLVDACRRDLGRP